MQQIAKRKVLIVEDDLDLGIWVCDYLSSRGMLCAHVPSGQAALSFIASEDVDLIVLDGCLPDIDGFEVCKRVKAIGDFPIIILTARDEEVDEVMGLEAGADDYLTKPVRARALLTRIQKTLDRRYESRAGAALESVNRLAVGELVIEKSSLSVCVRGQPVTLTVPEFELLWLLASRAGEVVSRQSLVEELRGFDFDGFDRSIDLRVSRLRKKLGDDATNPSKIKTIRGRGYLLSK